MDVEDTADLSAASVAAAIGEPARARMLYCLMDGHARTSTELAVVAEVSASTASAHLHRLSAAKLVAVLVQGRHRYYRLAGAEVARVLEGLNVLAGRSRAAFVSRTPSRLTIARTCYDHMAGRIAVLLFERLQTLRFLRCECERGLEHCELTAMGEDALVALGVDIHALRAQRRRFAYACLDWSERRPHLGGALGAALLALALRRRWVRGQLDSRALTLTRGGVHELAVRFGIEITPGAAHA